MITWLGRRGRSRDEAGATLVEVLVAVAILSIAAVAILAGLQLSVKTSDIHRKQSTAGAFVRNYAEAIQQYVAAGNYQPCAGANFYSPGKVGYDVPGSYGAHQDAAVPLAGDGSTGSCPGGDDGVQRVHLTMTSSDGRAVEELHVVLRNPCAPGGPTCS